MYKWAIVGVGLALILATVVAIIALLIGPVAGRLARKHHNLSDKEAADVLAATRDTLLKAAGGIILLLGAIGTVGTLIYTARTARSDQQQAAAAQGEVVIARDGQITDRYATAIGQLGASNLEERIGGIYALSGIMRDSHQDQPSVIDVLTAFVRDAGRRPDTSSPPPDVQAALTIIALRNPKWDHGAINLYDSYLYNVELDGANLAGAELGAAFMGGIQLSQAHLHSADLGSADLSDSDLNGADLTDTNLSDHTDLSGATLVGADLRGANLKTADLSGADLRGADLRGSHGLTRKQVATAKINNNTRLPSGL